MGEGGRQNHFKNRLGKFGGLPALIPAFSPREKGEWFPLSAAIGPLDWSDGRTNGKKCAR